MRSRDGALTKAGISSWQRATAASLRLAACARGTVRRHEQRGRREPAGERHPAPPPWPARHALCYHQNNFRWLQIESAIACSTAASTPPRAGPAACDLLGGRALPRISPTPPAAAARRCARSISGSRSISCLGRACRPDRAPPSAARCRAAARAPADSGPRPAPRAQACAKRSTPSALPSPAAASPGAPALAALNRDLAAAMAQRAALRPADGGFRLGLAADAGRSSSCDALADRPLRRRAATGAVDRRASSTAPAMAAAGSSSTRPGTAPGAGARWRSAAAAPRSAATTSGAGGRAE